MKTNFKLAAPLYIGNREVSFTTESSRYGVNVVAHFPTNWLRDGIEKGSRSQMITWDEIEADQTKISTVASLLGMDLIRSNLDSKLPGETYCDGTH